MARIKALIDGNWHGDLEETPEVRRVLAERRTRFRGWVTPDGGPGPDGEPGFQAEPGRYHLYVSYACPWAHRTILYRRLKGLEDVVSMSVLHPRWATERGWTFGESDMSTPDHANGFGQLHEVYLLARPDATTKVTVPVLWDRRTRNIVSRESGDIIRMLGRSFDAWGNAGVDFLPEDLRDRIEGMNALILPKLSNGVYRAGFARSQAAYDEAVVEVFDALDQLEAQLADGRPYLLGSEVTESDWHLFCTLVRFDAVYHGLLKCNLRRLVDYPRLSRFARRIYELPGVAETVRLDHIKRHYHDDMGELDHTIVPAGPAEDFTTLGG